MRKGSLNLSGKELEEAKAMIRTEWFKNHKAMFTDLPIGGTAGHVRLLEWRNPDSWCYAVRYVIWSNTLYVSGDLGEAVHCWSQHVTFPWIAGCNLGYYAEKCQASEAGRDFVEWDADILKAYLTNLFNEESGSETYKEILDESANNGGSANEWRCFVDGLYHGGHDLDTETLSAIVDAGYRISLRCIAHWLGIKMAVESLPKQP